VIIYIAGKINGCKDYKEIFETAEKILRKEGHTPLNPAVLPEDMPLDKYMPICMAMIDQADAVFILKNWVSSKGAELEKNYAAYQGKKIIFER